jgi:indole-3-glycerol phosphate synthase
VLLDALRQQGIAVIAEFKRDSPSHEVRARRDARVEDYVDAYDRGGARALSILTEESLFLGKLDDLREARQRTSLPILRKDFVISEYQVYEAAEAGADAILLIVAALKDEIGQMRSLYDLARELALDVLIEIRTREELALALDIGAELVGINNRNLDTFKVDVETTHKLVELIPKHVTIVSESGLHVRQDLDALEEIGVHAALIGSALMDGDDPEAKCRELTRTGLRASTARASSSVHPALA